MWFSHNSKLGDLTQTFEFPKSNRIRSPPSINVSYCEKNEQLFNLAMLNSVLKAHFYNKCRFFYTFGPTLLPNATNEKKMDRIDSVDSLVAIRKKANF